MTDRIDIPAQEHGVIRIFAVNLPEAEVASMLRNMPPPATPTGDLPEVPAAAALLGWPDLDTRYAALFAIRDLTGVGLTGYLTEGLGLEEAQISPDHARLTALDGYVLIVMSRAFGGQPVALHLPAALTLIGTYREKAAPVIFEPLPAGGAQDAPQTKGRKPVSDAAMSGRIATIALLVLFLLTGLLVWMAG